MKLASVAWPKEPFETWRASVENQVPEAIPVPSGNYTLPKISEGGCIDDTWTATAGPPEARVGYRAVWTGSEMIVWGGYANFSSSFGNNSSNLGGGGFNIGTVEIGETILNMGASGSNISSSGKVISHGYNLISDDGGGFLTGPGDQINTDPLLGSLQDNGGPTFTHELLLGSPAINTGDPNFTPPPFSDQRGPGFDRVVNGRIDIGSFEVHGPTPTPHLRQLPLRLLHLLLLLLPLLRRRRGFILPQRLAQHHRLGLRRTEALQMLKT